ncbi:MAG: hypothetical protein ACT4PI_12935 [Actinomycetota bacterium]
MPNGDRLPDEIVLTLEEAGAVLLDIDAGIENLREGSDARRRLERAARIIVEKLLPDFRDL